MSSEARILREGGVEALRAYWREKARQRYVSRVSERPSTCMDCDDPIRQKRLGRPRLRCLHCAGIAQNHGRLRKESARCVRCGLVMSPGRNGQRRYCSACRSAVDREQRERWRASQAITNRIRA